MRVQKVEHFYYSKKRIPKGENGLKNTLHPSLGFKTSTVFLSLSSFFFFFFKSLTLRNNNTINNNNEEKRFWFIQFFRLEETRGFSEAY